MRKGIVGAALRTGRTYVAKDMDVRERRARDSGDRKN
jgi:hypothetical protein